MTNLPGCRPDDACDTGGGDVDPAAWSDEELVRRIAGGARRAARASLRAAGGPRALAGWTIAELSSVPGLGAQRAARLAAAFELGRRAAFARLPRGATLDRSEAVYRHFAGRLRDRRIETFVVALLDVQNRLLRDETISVGCLSTTVVHPREAFGAAIREPAHAVAFVHNHPSGRSEPSAEDLSLTRRLVAAGDLLGIRVLDHVIVGDGEWYSFADEGRLR